MSRMKREELIGHMSWAILVQKRPFSNLEKKMVELHNSDSAEKKYLAHLISTGIAERDYEIIYNGIEKLEQYLKIDKDVVDDFIGFIINQTNKG